MKFNKEQQKILKTIDKDLVDYVIFYVNAMHKAHIYFSIAIHSMFAAENTKLSKKHRARAKARQRRYYKLSTKHDDSIPPLDDLYDDFCPDLYYSIMNLWLARSK